jgi:DNA-binding response OmpR family regulator
MAGCVKISGGGKAPCRVSGRERIPREEDMQRLLIVDDDQELGQLLTEYLSSEGLVVSVCHRGDDGLAKALADAFDLVILDVMLPGLSGLEVLRHLRATSAVPVIMLTARGDDIDRIVGLELGADDYLAKPFNPRELVARIKAVCRRTAAEKAPAAGPIPPGDVLCVGDLEMQISGRIVSRGGETVPLTEVEFHILEVLLRSAGQVVPRQDLAMQALGRRLSFEDRSLDVHISNLRRKIGHRMGRAERIKTIRGVGYLYAVLAD